MAEEKSAWATWLAYCIWGATLVAGVAGVSEDCWPTAVLGAILGLLVGAGFLAMECDYISRAIERRSKARQVLKERRRRAKRIRREGRRE